MWGDYGRSGIQQIYYEDGDRGGKLIRARRNYGVSKWGAPVRVAWIHNQLHTRCNLIAHFRPKSRKGLCTLNKHMYRRQIART